MFTRVGALLALVLVLSVAPIVVSDLTPPAQEAGAACLKAPPARAARTRFGVGLSTADARNLGVDLEREERRFNTRIPVIRTWDTGIPRTDAWNQRSQWFGKRWIVTSLKLSPQDVLSGRHDAELRHYFQVAPTDRRIYYSFFHEPEDEVKAGRFTKRQFRRAFRRVVRIAATTCKKNLFPTLVLMGWTADSASRLNWRDYYPGPKYVSVLAWDPYNGANGDATSYRAPKHIFGHVVRASRSAGKPMGIAETGSVRIPGDAAGTGRAAWLRKSARYLKRRDALFVTYFQSRRKGDFELRDKASVAAWRAAMR